MVRIQVSFLMLASLAQACQAAAIPNSWTDTRLFQCENKEMCEHTQICPPLEEIESIKATCRLMRKCSIIATKSI